MTPRVAIVILNWNGRKFLEQFLPSVKRSSYTNFTIVVADNASTDDSIEYIREAHPDVELIRLGQNFGYARGYNEALRQVTSDYYVLLNSDVEVTEGWIEPVIQIMETDRAIAACQPKLLLFAKKNEFEYSGACGGWLDRFGYPFARGRIFDVCEEDQGQYDAVAPVFWASGAAMFVRSSTYHEVGGIDDYFFAHQEEIDFCWRLQRRGFHVYCCPQSVVYHVGGGTLPKGNSRKVFLNFRNNLVMMAKNMAPGEATWKITYRFFLDFISAFKQLLAGEGTYFAAVIRAHFAFLAWLFTHKKSHNDPHTRGTHREGYYRGSIVWAHFARRKKKFSEIITTKT